ncbi:DUF2142 domain-containing protein [Aldersonia kunmingensis]|uniref:DUF2142 domain-containing protein n=1 Tax=Aldersonia kunmingensis TaxID=408066 RepID=UPI0008298469|nr:DUF2142 domain-containing protein [Aldersonia kunmingensis]
MTTTSTDVPASLGPNEPPEPAQPERARSRFAAVFLRVGPASVIGTLLAAIFGVTFAVITPPFWGHDEITQFGRAYQVAHGGIQPQQIYDNRGVSYGGEVPISVDALMGYALDDYTNSPEEPAPLAQSPRGYELLENQPVTSAERTIWFTNTSAYSPLPYLPAAAGIRVAELLDLNVGGLMLATRLAGLAVYLALIAFALRALRGSRVQWLVCAVALLPITVFQAGTVTADTMTNAIAILVSALLLKGLFLGMPLNRVETAALLTAAVALPLCKPAYALLAMAVLVVPAERMGLSGWKRVLPWLFAAIGAAAFVAWNAISSPTTEGMGLMRRESQWHSVRPGDQLSEVLGDPLHFSNVLAQSVLRRDQEWFDEFFGELGFGYVTVPATSIVACLIALALALGIAERFTASHLRTAIVGAGVAVTTAAIFGTLYLGFSPVGYFIVDGVQGRYFVPLAIVAFAVLLRWVPLRLSRDDGRTPGKGAAIAIVAAIVIALVAAVAKYYVLVWG